MTSDEALNRYIEGTGAWSSVVSSMNGLLTVSAVAFLDEITLRMPTGPETDRRDAVETLLKTWPLAKFFGWHEGRVVRVERREGEGVTVWQD